MPEAAFMGTNETQKAKICKKKQAALLTRKLNIEKEDLVSAVGGPGGEITKGKNQEPSSPIRRGHKKKPTASKRQQTLSVDRVSYLGQGPEIRGS